MRKVEYPLTTDEQVEEFTRKALALVEEIDPPSDLRAAVFAGVLGLYSGRQVVFEQVGGLMSIPRNHG